MALPQIALVDTPRHEIRIFRGDKMISTGIEPFDTRIGGLTSGRYYVLSGAPGSGKTSAALHFLGAGLENEETCAILTQDDPADLMAQASYVGYDFHPPLDEDRLLLFRYRLDFQRHYSRVADPELVFEELKSLLWEKVPHRFVIDSVLPILEGGLAADDAVDAFSRFLEEIPCTTYITVPGDLNESYYRRMYNRITAGAAGIFHFEHVSGAVRQMTVQKLRQDMPSAEPIRFLIRPGAGIVEDLALRSHDDLPDEVRRRVVLLNSGARIPSEWIAPLGDTFEVVNYDSVVRAFADLASANYGALLMGMDPMDPEPALNLTRELRRAGNGAPILFVSPVRGLRARTRTQGLRAGGDDFLVDTLNPGELVARVDSARQRGHRRLAVGSVAAEPPVTQPVDESSQYQLMAADLFREMLRSHVDRSRQAFFALVLLGSDRLEPEQVWDVLRNRLRIRDGDLVARMEDGQFALYLHDIHRKHVQELLSRLVTSSPGLADPDATLTLAYPADADAVKAWLSGDGETVSTR